MKIPVYDLEGKVVAEETLEAEILKEPLNQDVVHYYVVSYLANQRRGTASAKTRSEVSGSGRKPWRQKGTGRARAGSIRSPLWRHGGVVFGPRPRNYYVALPGKVKVKALQEALKAKLQENKVGLLQLSDQGLPKTRIFAGLLKKSGLIEEKVLLVLSKETPYRQKVIQSVRNLPQCQYDYADQLNAYEVVQNDHLLIQRDSFPQILKLLGATNGV